MKKIRSLLRSWRRVGMLSVLVATMSCATAEEAAPELETKAELSCLSQCDWNLGWCLGWIERSPDLAREQNWTVLRCIGVHQSCRLACPPECYCHSGSWCCPTSNGTLECTPQGTCGGGGDGGDGGGGGGGGGGGDGGDGGGGGGGGGGGCDDDWDCGVIEECSSSGSCVPLGCG